MVALLVALKGNKKFILFFMAFYPVLPDYFAIELGGGLPLLKASRILLLILMLSVCFYNKKIYLIRQPLKDTGLYWPLFIYFAARILANGYYAPSLSAAINTEFNPDLDKYAVRFADYAGLPLIRVSPLLHQARRGGKFVYCPDIGGFLDLIKNATYMITDSFHGTAFAINFNTQFVEVIPNTGTGSRNMSILLMAGLENRVIQDLNDFKYCEKIIDFSITNNIISRNRKASIDLLQRFIQKKYESRVSEII